MGWTCNVMPSMTSRGSMTLPRDLDILRPWASRTMECRYTCLKGALPASYHTTNAHNTSSCQCEAEKAVAGKHAMVRPGWCKTSVIRVMEAQMLACLHQGAACPSCSRQGPGGNLAGQASAWAAAHACRKTERMQED